MPVQVLDERAQKTPEVDSDSLRRICLRLLTAAGLAHNAVSVVLLDDERMAEYNQRYRNKAGPTNVLSFPALFPPATPAELRADLGDVLIAVATAAREANEKQAPLVQRLQELLLHGILHLAGYDHERSETEALVMWDRERELLTQAEARRTAMPQLSVNVDHIATLRQARGGFEPDPVLAAGICELAGASGIVVHLREDRRHIQERDVRVLRQTVKTHLNLEMAATRELVAFAADLKPDMVTLVPEKRQELTTEGGLDVAGQKKKLSGRIAALKEAGIQVSLFVDPEPEQLQAATAVGATHVELHTGRYSNADSESGQEREYVHICRAVAMAAELSLRAKAGHGLDYRNTGRIAGIAGIEDLSIGHAIMARAVLVGLERAVREMLELMRQAAAPSVLQKD